MERVAFIVEHTGQRLGCLLNPESVLVRRRAGVEPLRSAGGLVAGAELADDPLLLTGGGTTELTLDLLFDVSLAGSSVPTGDVRALTGPLWDLAENSKRAERHGRPPLARFVWGKAWNIPGIVTAIAERLECFSAVGVPRRSWLSLRMIRVAESAADRAEGTGAPGALDAALDEELAEKLPAFAGDRAASRDVTAVSRLPDVQGPIVQERLDELAFRHYGDASLWRLLARVNGIADPLNLGGIEQMDIPTGTAQGSVP